MLEELQNVSIEQEVFTLSRTKDYVITDLRRDRECLSDARRALQKAKYENERRAKAHCKALNSYEKHQNSKDVDKYRVVYADKMALFEIRVYKQSKFDSQKSKNTLFLLNLQFINSMPEFDRRIFAASG